MYAEAHKGLQTGHLLQCNNELWRAFSCGGGLILAETFDFESQFEICLWKIYPAVAAGAKLADRYNVYLCEMTQERKSEPRGRNNLFSNAEQKIEQGNLGRDQHGSSSRFRGRRPCFGCDTLGSADFMHRMHDHDRQSAI